ncbi:MAG: CHAT domain-containing protein, partial [Bacteroidetes bacterium]|nr:CHAT domain-containing protein [Bacteroidota bacterium]
AQRKPRESNRTAVMMGFPDYGPGGQVAPLPGTKKELQNIQQVLAASNIKTEVYLAKEASEEIIKEVNNPSILHIATHGFFLTDLEVESEKVFGIEVEKAKNNPLLRSGLMLAGAEKVITGEFEISTNDNGILTAYEAMNLQLDATDIVVLSACETGLGDVKVGEGVYGLQRAFMVAGSQSVVMSLWKVSDEATQALMTDFYTIWLQTGDKRAAFKKAQLNLKSRYAAPYYWGAFVLVGV